jgi:UDPglucose--hexose-1-phosphate uridylyltransferase
MEKRVLYENIDRLIQYGLTTGLIPGEEVIYTRNQLLEVFGEEEYQENDASHKEVQVEELPDILEKLLDYAVASGVLKEDGVVFRDLFDTKLMNCLMPRPAQVSAKFWELYQKSPKEATDYYYKFSQDSDYIRRYRIAKDMRWSVPSAYGEIDISINLSKPEKDPKAIAAAKLAKQSSYPKCLLCRENVGYAGRINHPARNNHRIIPITINSADWGFQYSPYVYYNEHCIVFCGEHVPMKIERATFVKLFDFIKLFPHYFLGSNADLPIVGGSILSHDHYQGGNYTFAMAKAPIEQHFIVPDYEDVEAGIVKWPLSVIRIRHKDEKRLIDLAEHILEKWRGYTDESALVFAETKGEPHNTITPIARKVGDTFELDLALRNNLTTEEYPLGLYHPHQEYHHIKKENIGLIEVMGLAVLPARLKGEMELLKDYILNHKDLRSHPELEKHADWVEKFLPSYSEVTEETIDGILKKEIGIVFTGVLEDAGVYKCTPEGREAFGRFIQVL